MFLSPSFLFTDSYSIFSLSRSVARFCRFSLLSFFWHLFHKLPHEKFTYICSPLSFLSIFLHLLVHILGL
jgi:hypothetical protein